MVDIQDNSVLRRKAREGRQQHQARAMSPEKAMRVALAKSADTLFGLEMTVTEVVRDSIAKPDVAGCFEDADLLLMLDGPGGCVGAVSLDVQVVAALIEHQTIGSVSSRKAVNRATTRVDAAMAAPLVNDLMQRFAILLRDERETSWASGYRFGVMLEDVRALDLVLEDHKYHLFRLQVDLGGGMKSGLLRLALAKRDRPVLETTQDASKSAGQTALSEVVMQTPAEMTAVLARFSLPFDELSALKVGDVVPIPGDALKGAALEAGQAQRIAAVTLGQLDGFRAVRLGQGGHRRLVQAAEADVMPDQPIAPSAREPLTDVGLGSMVNIDADAPMILPEPGAMADLPAMGEALPDLNSGLDDGLADFPALDDLPELGEALPPLPEI